MPLEDDRERRQHSRHSPPEKPERECGSWGHGGVRVGIIGAGPCGLAATKALLEAGIEPVCFESADRVGGLWVFDNQRERSAAYRSLHINTSSRNSQFADFAMPPEAGDFPHHEQIAAYLQAYAEHFSLLRCIRFNHRVEKCTPQPNGGYTLIARRMPPGQREANASERPESHHLDAVVVANGHHWCPKWPDPLPPGEFRGKTLHSRDYVDPTTPWDSRGKTVVVVGLGNSAVDIACELTRSARRVLLSTRRGAWVIPKYILGKPADQGTLVPYWLPPKLRRRIATWGFVALYGSMKKYGLPKPDHLIGEAHPTMSNELLDLVSRGDIEVRGPIVSLEDDRVRFAGDQCEVADAIVFCTGYRVAFPFFDADHVEAPNNQLPLFQRVFHPRHRHVFFVGLAQPLGAIIPVAEAQSRLIALHLAGQYNLPSQNEMDAAIAREECSRQRRYVSSPRHTMQIDPTVYQKTLRKEVTHGQRRNRQGRGIPFPSLQSQLRNEEAS